MLFGRKPGVVNGSSWMSLWSTWFGEKLLPGMAVVHTCTGSVFAYDLEFWCKAMAQNTMDYGKPAFNIETGRESGIKR